MWERSQSRVIRFDESLVPGSDWNDLDEELTRRFLLQGDSWNEDNLQKLRVVAADDHGVLRPTVAGVLMCTRRPHELLRHAWIQAVCYAGERYDVNYQVDAQDLEGPSLDLA